jgi:hypothetical protein
MPANMALRRLRRQAAQGHAAQFFLAMAYHLSARELVSKKAKSLISPALSRTAQHKKASMLAAVAAA